MAFASANTANAQNSAAAPSVHQALPMTTAITLPPAMLNGTVRAVITAQPAIEPWRETRPVRPAPLLQRPAIGRPNSTAPQVPSINPRQEHLAGALLFLYRCWGRDLNPHAFRR